MVLKIQRDLSNTFGKRVGSINMAIVSSLDPLHLRYQYSNEISYFYFASLRATAPSQSIIAKIANN